MTWMIPINDLDAVQFETIEQIIKSPKTNHWVKGFVGTGKTVVLTHVLERLASKKPPLKVCFATFTNALKDLVESGLKDLALRKIKISTFSSLNKLSGDFYIIVAD